VGKKVFFLFSPSQNKLLPDKILLKKIKFEEGDKTHGFCSNADAGGKLRDGK